VKDNKEEPGIVGIPYTPRQLFWISFAQVKLSQAFFVDKLLRLLHLQVWCFKYRDESLNHAILTGTHAPGEHRVLGSVSNSVDFARDFQCPIGSKMNPEKKCSVW
jgi:membrane metallo-endopeptidase-like protein 1